MQPWHRPLLPSALVLELTPEVRDEMLAHAVAGLPNEACGVFAATTGRDSGSGTVVRFFPLTNTAASSRIYEIDGAELARAELAADEAGLLVVGVMHSHTHTTNYPSPTDIRDAANFDPLGTWHFIIVSLKHVEPSLRSYRILDGQVTEEVVATSAIGTDDPKG